MQIDEINVDMVPVESSNVAKIGYNEKETILAFEMQDGNLYYYLDVPKLHYDNLLICASIGSYMHRNIKGNYRYIRIR
jgi:hypothetical protein